MKKIVILLLGVLLFTGCVMTTEDQCLEICEDYFENYQNYLVYKYDGVSIYSRSDITQPKDWMKVKTNCPEFYEEFIAPVKVIWDSLNKIPIEVIQYQGLSDDIIKTKLKIKQIESIRGKMKRSDNSTLEIGNDTYFYLDSLR